MIEVVCADPKSRVWQRPSRRDPGYCGVGSQGSRSELGAELPRKCDQLGSGCSGRVLRRGHDWPRQHESADEADQDGPNHGLSP